MGEPLEVWGKDIMTLEGEEEGEASRDIAGVLWANIVDESLASIDDVKVPERVFLNCPEERVYPGRRGMMKKVTRTKGVSPLLTGPDHRGGVDRCRPTTDRAPALGPSGLLTSRVEGIVFKDPDQHEFQVVGTTTIHIGRNLKQSTKAPL